MCIRKRCAFERSDKTSSEKFPEKESHTMSCLINSKRCVWEFSTNGQPNDRHKHNRVSTFATQMTAENYGLCGQMSIIANEYSKATTQQKQRKIPSRQWHFSMEMHHKKDAIKFVIRDESSKGLETVIKNEIYDCRKSRRQSCTTAHNV